MKLTWFGKTTMRIHIGGQILVVDPAGAPVGIDAAELVSGADQIMASFGYKLPVVDGSTWKPRKPQRLLDEGEAVPEVNCLSIASGSVLVDAVGEPPLLLLNSIINPAGRWIDSAVVVAFGDGPLLAEIGQSILDARAPRQLVLAGDESAVDIAFDSLRGRLDGTGLVALEMGLALEI